MWWLIIPAAVVVFLAVVLVRAACFKPGAPERREETPPPSTKRTPWNRCGKWCAAKTVSSRNEAEEDPAEFERFRALLCERYPRGARGLRARSRGQERAVVPPEGQVGRSALRVHGALRRGAGRRSGLAEAAL